MQTQNTLFAGASQIDISPDNSQFLYGYPHVKRYSEGVRDPLMSSALYLRNLDSQILIITNDLIYIDKVLTQRIRAAIHRQTQIPESDILISATHTHSGPIIVYPILCQADSVIPQPDTEYIDRTVERICQNACAAVSAARPCRIGLSVADATGIGTNRRDPAGPADLDVPVLLVKDMDNAYVACMIVCCMHPTVLHEDSLLVSADFPGFARMYLQNTLLGKDCPVLHHTGPAGNQSPRHVTTANTFAEAERIGGILGKAVAAAVNGTTMESDVSLAVENGFVELPLRDFPSPEAAQKKLNSTVETLKRLRAEGTDPKAIRTAEVDWFGAEREYFLSTAHRDGTVAKTHSSQMPAEIQIIRIGQWRFVAWPGEIFIEYALQLKKQFDHTFVISLANGVLNGYLVTEDSFREGGYEASSGLASHKGGPLLVNKTVEMLSDQTR